MKADHDENNKSRVYLTKKKVSGQAVPVAEVTNCKLAGTTRVGKETL